ncbi:MAG: signal recognition particle-docking protein FtsY, partial [Flavobacteriia bacterium]|nr:signal recognition particle-docking protein FtsY [Candidatus Bostrichicola ureolyticus]
MIKNIIFGLLNWLKNLSFLSKKNLIKNEKHKIDKIIEEILISSDIGSITTLKIIDNIKNKFNKKLITVKEFNILLKEELLTLLHEPTNVNLTESIKLQNPYILMIVGVNGVGKTTTVGKLAYLFKKQGLNVLISAADTFRAAAEDQLNFFAKKTDSFIYYKYNCDPSAIVYDTIQLAKKKNIDVVIIDTAGRLHTRKNLMNELSKIKRTIQKLIPSGPNETILVLDGSTGQNSLEQIKQFLSYIDLSSLIVTKLDGTSKGGIIISISDKFKIPVNYIGIGEDIKDLIIFDKYEFVNSFIKKNNLLINKYNNAFEKK